MRAEPHCAGAAAGVCSGGLLEEAGFELPLEDMYSLNWLKKEALPVRRVIVRGMRESCSKSADRQLS